MVNIDELIELETSDFSYKISELDSTDLFELECELDNRLSNMVDSKNISQKETKGLTLIQKKIKIKSSMKHFKIRSRAKQNVELLMLMANGVDSILCNIFSSMQPGSIVKSVHSCESIIYQNMIEIETACPSKSGENIGHMILEQIENLSPTARIIVVVFIAVVTPIAANYIFGMSDTSSLTSNVAGILGGGITDTKPPSLLGGFMKLLDNDESNASSSQPRNSISCPNIKGSIEPPFCD